MGQQIYIVSVTLSDGSTTYSKFVQMSDQQAQALTAYLAACVANNYSCTAASVTPQETPISYGAITQMLINNFALSGINTPPLP
jgi:hypothetical protein